MPPRQWQEGLAPVGNSSGQPLPPLQEEQAPPKLQLLLLPLGQSCWAAGVEEAAGSNRV